MYLDHHTFFFSILNFVCLFKSEFSLFYTILLLVPSLLFSNFTVSFRLIHHSEDLAMILCVPLSQRSSVLRVFSVSFFGVVCAVPGVSVALEVFLQCGCVLLLLQAQWFYISRLAFALVSRWSFPSSCGPCRALGALGQVSVEDAKVCVLSCLFVLQRQGQWL